MQIISILLAAAACFGIGAIYYMALQKPWLAAIGKTQQEIQTGSAKPYIVSLIAQIIAVCFMRYVFVLAGVNSMGQGFWLGAGMGAFIAGAWIFINNGYELKPMALSVINAGYSIIGLGVAGLILGFFL